MATFRGLDWGAAAIKFEFEKMVGGPGFEPGASRSRTVVALGSGEIRQRPFEFTASAASVRQVSLGVGGCRPGCYTTWAKSLRPER